MRKYYFETFTESYDVAELNHIAACVWAPNKKAAQLIATQLAFPNVWEKLGWQVRVTPVTADNKNYLDLQVDEVPKYWAKQEANLKKVKCQLSIKF